MNSIKLINEEVSRMKSLFGYKRGKVVSEQEMQEIGIGASALLAAKNASVSAKRQTPPPIPTELKDINGVKAFQDWLDKNHVGWATGYNGGMLNKVGKGYGRMGPRTTNSWSQYKDEYLKSLQTAAQDDKNSMTDITPENGNTAVNNSTNTSNNEDGDYNPTNKSNTNNGNDITDYEPDNNTTAQQTTTQKTTQQTTIQKSPQPPTEPGEPGEERDGWTFDEKRQTWY